MRFYFCTTSNKFGESMILTPRIPESLEIDREDNKTKRICVSNSIIGCLSAIGQNLYIDQEVKVYYCDIYDMKYIHQPTVEEVADVEYTGEYWLLSETKFNLLKKVKITKRIQDMFIDESRLFYFEFKNVIN